MMTLPPIEFRVIEPRRTWKPEPVDAAFWRGAIAAFVLELAVIAVVWAACKIGGLL